MPENYFLQYKYDGNRCLITKQKGQVFAYSRNGKLIDSIDHILEVAKDIPEGTTLDGELYHHGTPLQTIRSWIARNQAESNSLVYMCYDIITDDSYHKRHRTIQNLNLSHPIILAKTELITPLKLAIEPLSDRLKLAIDDGYEGLIARDAGTAKVPYADGKRSAQLIKIKEWLDSEFQVVDISASTDNWAILHMKSDNGKTFRASAPGSMADKGDVLYKKSDYIGRTVTLKYAYLTKEGIPFHPVAVAWREGLE